MRIYLSIPQATEWSDYSFLLGVWESAKMPIIVFILHGREGRISFPARKKVNISLTKILYSGPKMSILQGPSCRIRFLSTQEEKMFRSQGFGPLRLLSRTFYPLKCWGILILHWRPCRIETNPIYKKIKEMSSSIRILQKHYSVLPGLSATAADSKPALCPLAEKREKAELC